MIYSTTLTQKGQVTIPAMIRKLLHLKPYQKVAFEISGTQVTIKKIPEFLSLKGSLKTSKTFDDTAADSAILKHIAKEYGKKNS